jgi:DNA-binding GntR family transcriptional regulator
MPDGGIRGGYMIKPMDNFGIVRTHGASRDEPHDQFDPLRARFAHVFQMWHAGQSVRIGDQLIQERLVPSPIDESSPLPLQLMMAEVRSAQHFVDIHDALVQTVLGGDVDLACTSLREHLRRTLREVYS